MSITGNGHVAKVYYRIFPSENIVWDLLKVQETKLYIRSVQDASQGKGNLKYWEFTTDGIFHNNCQELLYSLVLEDLLERIIKGFDGIIVGFGQTGSGKSFTLSGLNHTEQEFGIIPRVVFDLFKLKKELASNIKMSIQLTFTEFSKSNVNDLLKEYPNSIDPWHVRSATKIKVRTEFEALKLIYKGEGRKLFAKNSGYRSHICTSVLTFYITTANRDYTCPEKIFSRLHIIDMAGVDSVGNATSTFKTPFNVGEANVVKSYMEQFILYLQESLSGSISVKERTNPLIYFLGSDLRTENILRFIGHIRINIDDLKITVSTLRFGQYVKGLRPKKKHIEPEVDDKIRLRHLQNRVEHLQKEKMLDSILMNQDLTVILNQNRMEQIQRTIDAYLQNRVGELNVLNVAEAAEAFKVFKNLCNISLEEDKAKAQQELDLKAKRGSRTNSRSSIKIIKSVSKRIRRQREGSDPEKAKLKGTTSQTHLKKIKSNSVSITKRSSIVKSTNSSIKDKKDSKGNILESLIIPDIIPEFRDVWHIFANDVKSTYKVLHDSYRLNEGELRYVYLDYTKEMKKLAQCKELVERRQHELIEAKMFHQYISSDVSLHVITESEKLCQEHLDDAKAKLLVQKEKVLKLQSELKMYLNNRRVIKQQLRDDFDNYCKEKYSTNLPNAGEEELVLNDLTIEMDLNQVDEDTKEEELQKSTELIPHVHLIKLKRIMTKELQKTKALRELNSKKWKNS